MTEKAIEAAIVAAWSRDATAGGAKPHEHWAKLAARAVSALPPLRAREEIARAALAQCVEWRDKKWSPKTISILGLESPSDAHIDEARKFTEETWARARAVLALSSTAGQEWRDISSAPKTGGKYNPETAGPDLWLWAEGWGQPQLGCWIAESIVHRRGAWMVGGGREVHPTHYLPDPYPTPPTALLKESGGG